MIRTFRSPDPGLDPIEADAFSVVWADPEAAQPDAVLVSLYLRYQVVFFDVYPVYRHFGNIDEWSCEPFGVPIGDLPWWLEDKLRWELEGKPMRPPAPLKRD